MNVARFNMAHGDHDYHAAMMVKLRAASRSTGTPVALLIDIKGPEVRTGMVAGGGTIELLPGTEILVAADDSPCTSGRISVTYADLPDQAGPGRHILIADGLIDLEVLAIEGRLTRCAVRTGGNLGSRKNVNIIGIKSRLPAITEKDRENIHFAVQNDMDFVAASFVRKPDDILEIRRILLEQASHLQIIAKIEDQEGLDNIDEIVRVADGIMIARGDLGVQIPTEEIPLVQKRIILKCHDAEQDGHHGDPDAGLHDLQPPAHAGRGHRRGQRHLRRLRRRHALGGDGERQVSRAGGPDHGFHRAHRRRVPRVRIPRAAVLPPRRRRARTSRSPSPAARSSWPGRSTPRPSSPPPSMGTPRGSSASIAPRRTSLP